MDSVNSVITAPTFEECAGQVPHNSYQICLGRDLKGEENYITLRLDNHLLLLGNTGTGKTCQAAQIIDQVTRTHDCDHLQVALLDPENEVCNLFADLSHVAQLKLSGGGTTKAIARSADEVAAQLGNLVAVVNERYTLAPGDATRQPQILVYLEEPFTVKWQLADRPTVLAQYTVDLAALAARGRKVGIHLMVCTQPSSSQREFREMIQPLTSMALAFCIQPSMGSAAGFHNDNLLAENYLPGRSGQFALESPRRATLGLAPYYDVKAKLQSLEM
jgi:hypothetical protein